jgi:hypothetical protein
VVSAEQIPTRGHETRQSDSAQENPKPSQLRLAVNDVGWLAWLVPKCQGSISRMFPSGPLYQNFHAAGPGTSAALRALRRSCSSNW